MHTGNIFTRNTVTQQLFLFVVDSKFADVVLHIRLMSTPPPRECEREISSQPPWKYSHLLFLNCPGPSYSLISNKWQTMTLSNDTRIQLDNDFFKMFKDSKTLIYAKPNQFHPVSGIGREAFVLKKSQLSIRGGNSVREANTCQF